MAARRLTAVEFVNAVATWRSGSRRPRIKIVFVRRRAPPDPVTVIFINRVFAFFAFFNLPAAAAFFHNVRAPLFRVFIKPVQSARVPINSPRQFVWPTNARILSSPPPNGKVPSADSWGEQYSASSALRYVTGRPGDIAYFQYCLGVRRSSVISTVRFSNFSDRFTHSAAAHYIYRKSLARFVRERYFGYFVENFPIRLTGVYRQN